MEADGQEQMRMPTSHNLQYHLEQEQTSSIYESKYNLENKKEDHRGLVHCRIYTNPPRNGLKSVCVQNMDFKLPCFFFFVFF